MQPPAANPYAGSSFGVGSSYVRPSHTPDRDSHRSNDSIRDKKHRAKDDIRKKLSDLSGKLYSPLKSAATLETAKDFENSVERAKRGLSAANAYDNYSSQYLHT